MRTSADVSSGTPLGREISVHRHDLFARDGVLGTSLALLGMLISPFFVSGIVNVMGIQAEHGIDPMADEENWGAFVLLLLWFVAGVRTVVHTLRKRLDRVTLQENGFTFRLGGVSGVRTYDDIEEVRHSAKAVHRLSMFGTRARDTFAIKSREKDDVVIGDLTRILALGRAIQDAVRHRLDASAMRHLQTRGDAAFGPIVLTLEGLRFQHETLLWSEIQSVTPVRWSKGLSFSSTTDIEDVVIRKAGVPEPWAIVAVSEVPNDFVLIDLANRLRAVEPTVAILGAQRPPEAGTTSPEALLPIVEPTGAHLGAQRPPEAGTSSPEALRPVISARKQHRAFPARLVFLGGAIALLVCLVAFLIAIFYLQPR